LQSEELPHYCDFDQSIDLGARPTDRSNRVSTFDSALFCGSGRVVGKPDTTSDNQAN
jgi:hypothetical protein